MEKKVKYNLISSIFFIFAGIVTIYYNCIGTYRDDSNFGVYGVIVYISSIGYIVSGILGLINLEGNSRRLAKISAIVMIVLSGLQMFVVAIALLFPTIISTAAISVSLVMTLIANMNVLYAIGLLVNKKVFSIISFSITCFILFVGQIVVTIMLSKQSWLNMGHFIYSGGEWLFLIFILLLPAFLFNAKAMANKNTINNF
jgi:hypothetical protein